MKTKMHLFDVLVHVNYLISALLSGLITGVTAVAAATGLHSPGIPQPPSHEALLGPAPPCVVVPGPSLQPSKQSDWGASSFKRGNWGTAIRSA